MNDEKREEIIDKLITLVQVLGNVCREKFPNIKDTLGTAELTLLTYLNFMSLPVIWSDFNGEDKIMHTSQVKSLYFILSAMMSTTDWDQRKRPRDDEQINKFHRKIIKNIDKLND